MAINKINSLALGNVGKVSSLAKTSMAKIKSLAKFSSAYSATFDGTNDYITAHDAGVSIDPGSGSISCWFRLDTTSSGREIFRLHVDNSNAIRCFYHAYQNKLITMYRQGGANASSSDTTAVENNGWHHLAYTWEIGRSESKMYLDGTNNANAAPETEIDNSETPFTVWIGTNADGGGGSTNYWDGNIDDFAIFDDVLTSAEVTAIYNGGGPKDESNHDHLVEYWRFENNTYNSSSNPHAITLVNGATFIGDVSTAFDTYSILLDGTDDYVTVDGAGSRVAGALGSVSIWIKLDTVTHSHWLYEIWADDNNVVRAYYHGGTNQMRCEHKGGGTEGNCATTTAVENNGWHHLVHTWDTGENQSVMYIDGSSVDTSTADEGFEGTITSINIGVRGHGWSSNTWKGDINDMAFFDDVLTSGEVSAIYNSGKPKDESSHSGLVGYWKMESNTDDSSSNSNTLTLVSGATYSTDVP